MNKAVDVWNAFNQCRLVENGDSLTELMAAVAQIVECCVGEIDIQRDGLDRELIDAIRASGLHTYQTKAGVKFIVDPSLHDDEWRFG